MSSAADGSRLKKRPGFQKSRCRLTAAVSSFIMKAIIELPFWQAVIVHSGDAPKKSPRQNADILQERRAF